MNISGVIWKALNVYLYHLKIRFDHIIAVRRTKFEQSGKIIGVSADRRCDTKDQLEEVVTENLN